MPRHAPPPSSSPRTACWKTLRHLQPLRARSCPARPHCPPPISASSSARSPSPEPRFAELLRMAPDRSRIPRQAPPRDTASASPSAVCSPKNTPRPARHHRLQQPPARTPPPACRTPAPPAARSRNCPETPEPAAAGTNPARPSGTRPRTPRCPLTPASAALPAPCPRPSPSYGIQPASTPAPPDPPACAGTSVTPPPDHSRHPPAPVRVKIAATGGYTTAGLLPVILPDPPLRLRWADRHKPVHRLLAFRSHSQPRDSITTSARQACCARNSPPGDHA